MSARPTGSPSPLQDIFIPPTFAEYFAALPFESVAAYLHETWGVGGALPTRIPDGGDQQLAKGVLIRRFSAERLSDYELRQKIAQLSAPAASSLDKLAFEFHGRLFLAMATGGMYKNVESLIPAGLAVRMEFDGRPAFVLPWEILDHVVREHGRDRLSPRSLLGFLLHLNKESLLRLIRRTGYKPDAAKKADLLLEIYRRLTGRFEIELEAMDERRLALLRELFRNGGELPAWLMTEHEGWDAPGPSSAWQSAIGFEREYFESYYFSRPPVETPEIAAARDLMARGIVVSLAKFDYPYSRRPALSEEAAPAVRAFFLREMESRAADLRKKLAVPVPSGPVVSYADRILDDLLKLQVAVSISQVVINKSGKLSSRSVQGLAKLLAVEEPYVLANLASLKLEYTEGGGPAHLEEGLRHPAAILRRAALGSPAQKGALALLREHPGWLGTKALRDYLDNHPKAAPWLFPPAPGDEAPRDAESVIARFRLSGFLESTPDARAVRLTGIADRLDDAEDEPAWAVIKEAARPVRVQPNLEILVPLTAEPALFKELAAFADLAVLDRMVHFALTRESLVRGLDVGWTPESILAWLERSSPVPATVREFVAAVGRKKGEASVLPCQAIVTCAGIGVKERILALSGVEAAVLPGAAGAPCLAIFHPPPGELVALLKKKKIYAEFADMTAESDGDGKGGKGGADGSGGPDASRGPGGRGAGSPPGRRAGRIEKALLEALKRGVKVRLGFHRGYRWRKTNLVTVLGLRKGRAYFLDRDGIASSLPLDDIDEVYPK